MQVIIDDNLATGMLVTLMIFVRGKRKQHQQASIFSRNE